MPEGKAVSGGKTASRGDTRPFGFTDIAAELDPDLLSILTNEDELDLVFDIKAGKAVWGAMGRGGTGGTGRIANGAMGAPNGI